MSDISEVFHLEDEEVKHFFETGELPQRIYDKINSYREQDEDPMAFTPQEKEEEAKQSDAALLTKTRMENEDIVAILDLSGDKVAIGIVHNPDGSTDVWMEHEDASEPTYFNRTEAQLLVAALHSAIDRVS